jgi:leucyl-tRNA synthetase
LAHLKHLEARNPLTGQPIAVLVADSPVDQEHTEEQAVMREPEEQQAQMLSEEQVRELFRSGIAHGCVRYRMRDWLISRQRAWGTPIPILYCPEHGPQTLKDHQLPLRLPNEISYPTTASNIVASPLAQNHSWTHSAKCPICNGPTVRETDTMDTFVDSSWYFLRFLDPHNTEKPFNPRFLSPNKPVVDWYIGGIEHAILHLLYARFITKVFADIEGLGRECEPFRKLLAQGLVQGQTRRCSKTNRYLKPDEHITDSNSDSSVLVTWEKMSKSKFNGVQPQSLIEKYGSDSIRLAMLFKAPPAISLNWDEKDIIGHERFLTRLLLQLYSTSQPQKVIDDSKWSEEMVQVAKLFNETIDHIKRDMEEASSPAFNVHIAMLMKLSNRLIDNVNDMPFEFKWTCLSKFAALLSPYAPCTATELADICLRTAPHIQKSTVPLDPLQIPQEAIESFNSNTSIAIYLNGKEVGKLLVPLEDLKNTSKLEQTAKSKFPQLESALNSFLVQGKQKLMINFVNSK